MYIWDLLKKNKDLDLLNKIKIFFNVGNIYHLEDNTSIQYRVESVSNLVVIIDHFNKYSLFTKKN